MSEVFQSIGPFGWVFLAIAASYFILATCIIIVDRRACSLMSGQDALVRRNKYFDTMIDNLVAQDAKRMLRCQAHETCLDRLIDESVDVEESNAKIDTLIKRIHGVTNVEERLHESCEKRLNKTQPRNSLGQFAKA